MTSQAEIVCEHGNCRHPDCEECFPPDCTICNGTGLGGLTEQQIAAISFAIYVIEGDQSDWSDHGGTTQTHQEYLAALQSMLSPSASGGTRQHSKECLSLDNVLGRHACDCGAE